MISDFIAAYKAAKEQRRRVRDYKKLVDKPVTFAAIKDVVDMAKSREVPIIVRFKDGAVMEFHGEQTYSNSKMRRQLTSEAQDMRSAMTEIEAKMFGEG